MITLAAIIYNGKIYTGKRHNYIMWELIAKFPEYKMRDKNLQGFVNESGLFLNRIEAAQEAIKCNQVAKLNWPPCLYSEDFIEVTDEDIEKAKKNLNIIQSRKSR